MTSRIFISSLFQQLFSIILLASVLSGAFSVSAQIKRAVKKPSGNPPPISKTSDWKNSPKCNGGWSGTIIYTKTLDENGTSDEPLISSPRDRMIQEWSHNLSYDGRMTVDGSTNPQIPNAFGKIEYYDVRMQHGIEKTFGACSAWKPEHWYIRDGKRDESETGNGDGKAQSFNLNVNELDGTYNFSFRFADAQGRYNLEDHTKISGYCNERLNEPVDISKNEETKIDGETGVVEDHKTDPKNPDILSGSVTIDRNDYTDPKRVKTPITVISWKFKRCSPPLMIANVKLSQPLYPTPNSWVEIKEGGNTIDGNQVKVVATVVNLSGETKYANVRFKELKENTLLPDGQISISLQPYETREIEYVWDTNGYAWKDANIWNQPETQRQIEVTIPDDRMTKDVEVDPKPVILIPGLFSKSESFGKFAAFFKNTPNTNWSADISPVFINRASAQNAPVVEKTVKDMQKKLNAWHVDLAAHSTGGLAGRSYINSLMPIEFDGRPTATHFVMLGTPNMGTPCAAGMDDIFTRVFGRPADAMREITIRNMEQFNRTITNRKGTKFSILVGNAFTPICQMDVPGDGITPNESAIWLIRDWKFSTVPARHENMLDEQANFLAITKWLAISPKGNFTPETATLRRDEKNKTLDTGSEEFGKFRNYGAMYLPAKSENYSSNADRNDDEPSFTTGIKLAAENSAEIQIPVVTGNRLTIVFIAQPNVSATLVNSSDTIVGTNLAGTPAAEGTFRIIRVENGMEKGTWKLKLENREKTEAEAAIAVFQ